MSHSFCQVTQFDVYILFFQCQVTQPYVEKVGTWYQFDVRVFPGLQGSFKYDSISRHRQANLHLCVKMTLPTVVLASVLLLCSATSQKCTTFTEILDVKYLIDKLQVSCGGEGGRQRRRQLLQI